MTPERARLIEELFAKALDSDPARRSEFLEEVCGADPELRHEVETLLAQGANSESFLQVPALELASRELASQSTSLIGQRLGPYELHELMGAGGMGNVYRATDTRLGRTVALKTLAEHISHLPAARVRLEREARTIAGLNHPHICVLHDVGEESGIDFIVMECLEGITLARRIQEGRLPLGEAVTIASAIGDALEKAHRAGVIHRDLKPANIMLTPNGPKLLDFGVAKILTAAPLRPKEDLTDVGVIVGTPRYIAPEQFDHKAPDERADIFGFGAVLYEMLTGQKAFPRSDQQTTPAAPSKVVPTLPAELDPIVLRCLAKDPSERWPSMTAVLEELRTVTQPGIRRSRKRALLVATVAAVLLFSLGLGLFFRDRIVVGNEAADRSIAVMPFLNLSPDRENEYFSDGLSDQLTDALANVPGLVVASRTSAFSLKGKQMEATEIGEKLHVGAIVEGSVQKSEDKLRVTAQLVRTRDGYHLWSQTFDRDFKNVFEIQDEISQAITHALKIRLTEEAARNLLRGSTRDPEALDLLLRGRQLLRTFGPGDDVKALALFQRALDRDPNFALAYVGIAQAEGSASIQEREPIGDLSKRVKATLDKALEIDSNLGEAYSIRGIAEARVDWNWAGAEQSFRRALALDPRSPEIHAAYAHSVLMPLRHYDEAVAECRIAEKLDPVSLGTAMCVPWVHLNQEGETETAFKEVQALLKDRASSTAPSAFSIFAILSGHEAWALALVDQLKIDPLELAAQDSIGAGTLAYAYAKAGKTAEALRIVTKLEDLSRSRYISPAGKCLAYLGLGKLDEARKAGEDQIREHSVSAYLLAFSPVFKPLLDDPKFAELVKTMGLPTATPRAF